MTEALRAVLGYAFDPLGLGLETVRWTALAGNEQYIGENSISNTCWLQQTKWNFTDVYVAFVSDICNTRLRYL